MAKFILQLEDAGDEIQVNAAIEPPLTEDRTTFTTAELVGLYLRDHMSSILKDAVLWAMEPEPAPIDEPAIKAPKLIPPDDITGAPV
jgi:hypothetical protein